VNAIYDFGIQVVVFIQSLGGWLLTPMQFFSLSGTEVFYMLIAPTLYWCISTEAGLRIGLFIMLSGGINDCLKVAMHAPRPYWYSTDVKALAAESTFGIPSGHAQHALVVWGTLAAWIKRHWMWTAAILMIFCISLSRLYLGVHFPTDVLAGWLVGILLVWGLLRFERRLTTFFLRQPLPIQLFVALLVSLSIIGLAAVARISVGDWQMPSEWAENAARAGGKTPNPLDSTGVIANAGAFFGLVAGAILLRRNGGFDAGKGTAWQMTVRYVLGLAGTIIIWYGLGIIIPREADLFSYSLSYLRYTLVGIWFAGLAPLVFMRLGLAEPKPRI
jgi:membrane-associated phospholipid phosphatase